jgi:ribonuclease-3
VKREGQGLLHKGAAAIFHENPAISKLTSLLGHPFKDPSLLRRALTHPSLSQGENNQRLEFLGDAVLQLCVSLALVINSKDAEGKLTRRRQHLVCEETLARIARGIGLGDCILMEEGLAKSGGRGQDSVLADTMEAVLAAVFLDGGLTGADGLVRRLWADAIAQADAELDPKGALQAWAAARGMNEPLYQMTGENGPPHQRLFLVSVSVNGEELASASGKTKKTAERVAAKAAMERLLGAEGRHEADQS